MPSGHFIHYAISLTSPFEVGSHYVAQAVLEFILLASLCCMLGLRVPTHLSSGLLKRSLCLRQLTVLLRSSSCCPTAPPQCQLPSGHCTQDLLAGRGCGE